MVSSTGRISFVDVLDAAVSDDPSGGLLHGVCSSTDAVIAKDHHADIAQRFDPLGLEVRAFGTITSGTASIQAREKLSISEGFVLFEWIRIMSAPASARARRRASASPRLAIKASVRAMTRKSGSDLAVMAASPIITALPPARSYSVIV